jgi:hypothetical protein
MKKKSPPRVQPMLRIVDFDKRDSVPKYRARHGHDTRIRSAGKAIEAAATGDALFVSVLNITGRNQPIFWVHHGI